MNFLLTTFYGGQEDMQFFVDRAKRKTRCCLCGCVIPKGDLRLGENFCSAGFVSQRYYCVSCGVRHLIKTVKTLVEILAYISEGD